MCTLNTYRYKSIEYCMTNNALSYSTGILHRHSHAHNQTKDMTHSLDCTFPLEFYNGIEVHSRCQRNLLNMLLQTHTNELPVISDSTASDQHSTQWRLMMNRASTTGDNHSSCAIPTQSVASHRSCFVRLINPLNCRGLRAVVYSVIDGYILHSRYDLSK